MSNHGWIVFTGPGREKIMREYRVRGFFLLSIIAVLAWTAPGAAPSPTNPTQVRLSWSISPKSSMTVVWQTALPTDSSIVEYGLSEKLGKTAIGRRVSYDYQTGTIHETVIEGLESGKRYFYRAGDPKGGFSARLHFDTAPASDEDFLFTAFGDHGVGNISKANVDLVLAEKPAFHLIMGDLSYANGRQHVWDRWFEQLEPLSSIIPIMPAVGNHENEKIGGKRIGYVAYLARLALPPPETRYHFDYAEARFVTFNSDDFENQEQLDWLSNTLKTARENKAVRWLIIFHHHLLYSSTVGRLNNRRLIKAVRSIMDTYKVDLVLTGHNHNYERSYPLVEETISQSGPGPYQKGQGLVFIVSGGGGRSLYKFVSQRPSITAYRESTPHYLRVRVAKKELQVEAVRTRDKSVLDAFKIQER